MSLEESEFAKSLVQREFAPPPKRRWWNVFTPESKGISRFGDTFWEGEASGAALLSTTYGSSNTEAILPTFASATNKAYNSNAIVFGAILARLMLFSEATFKFQHLDDKTLFEESSLSAIESPWPNGTTGELLARMIQDVDLAGNCYIWNAGEQLVRLRPDQVTIVSTEQKDVMGRVYKKVIGYYWDPESTPGMPRSDKAQYYDETEIAHWCVDEETEILTLDGWKDFKQISTRDEVLTLNHDTGMSEWQPVLEVMVFPDISREMVRMEGKEFSSFTTLNHRWPVERRNSRAGKYVRRWATSEDISSGDRIPVSALCADVPLEQKWNDALVEIIAWFWTEGGFASGGKPGIKGRGISIGQSHEKNYANVERIRSALRLLFGDPVKQMTRTGPRCDSPCCWVEAKDGDMTRFRLSANASDVITEHAPDKIVTTEFIRQLTLSQLDLFIRVSLLADNNGKNRLAQKNKRMAEQFALACTLAGYGVSIREGSEKINSFSDGSKLWNVRILNKLHVYPQVSNRPGTKFSKTVEEYKGHVWCPRTENQTWMARRGGSVYFTGNSPLPDPMATFRGMSWLTPVLREISADVSMTEYKLKYLGNAAAQPLDAKVATPSGWLLMGDMRKGTRILGPDGGVRRVVGVFPQGEKNVYRLTFQGGATTECCEDHVWTVRSTDNSQVPGVSRNMTLREIMDAGVSRTYGKSQQYKWAIPMTEPVEFDDPGVLPIDPYLLGCLLGDGCFGEHAITMASHPSDTDEMNESLSRLVPDGISLKWRYRGGWDECHFSVGERGEHWRYQPMLDAVNDCGLLGVKGSSKYIPAQYMMASIKDRISLLQGLIDTDGNTSSSAGAIFVNTSEQLVRQLADIAQSLGACAKISRCGVRKNNSSRSPQWQVYISDLPEWVVPCRLSRKVAQWNPRVRRWRYRTLRNVEYVGRQYVQCIKVDAEDGLYLTDDFVVTHNTPNMVIKYADEMEPFQLDALRERIQARYGGVSNAFKTLILDQGADYSVVGNTFEQMNFSTVQAAGENRILIASGVPGIVVGSKEGLMAATYSNYQQAMRRFSDITMRPLWRSASACLAKLVIVPPGSRLWFDVGDIAALRQGEHERAVTMFVKAQATQQFSKAGFTELSAALAVDADDLTMLESNGYALIKAQTLESLIRSGFEPLSCVKAIEADDPTLLETTGLVPKQLIMDPHIVHAEPQVMWPLDTTPTGDAPRNPDGTPADAATVAKYAEADATKPIPPAAPATPPPVPHGVIQHTGASSNGSSSNGVKPKGKPGLPKPGPMK